MGLALLGAGFSLCGMENVDSVSSSAGSTLGAFQINPDQIKRGKQIGGGSYGIVYKGEWNKQKVALKDLIVKSLSEEHYKQFEKEAKLWFTLRHPNILQLFGICVPRNPGDPYSMVMPLQEEGSLYKLLQSKTSLSWPQKNRIAVDVARALLYLHEKNIIHRDLKSPNVLIEKQGENYKALLTDFGLAELKSETGSMHSNAAQLAGTMLWMAPELMNGESPSKATDIWAYGMVLLELATRKRPFAQAMPAVVPHLILSAKLPKIPVDTPKEISQLIKNCWTMNPNDRPTIAQLFKDLPIEQESSDEDSLGEIAKKYLIKTGGFARGVPLSTSSYSMLDSGGVLDSSNSTITTSSTLSHNKTTSDFIEAVKKGKLDQVKKLVTAAGKTPFSIFDEKDQDGLAALHWATINGHKELVEYLLGKGANIESTTPKSYAGNYRTSLHLAALHGKSKIVLYLLSNLILAKKSVNPQDYNGLTPWAIAHWKRHTGICGTLGGNGGSYKTGKTDDFVSTELQRAAKAGELQQVKDALAEGAKINGVGSEGLVALYLAVMSNKINVVEYLLKNGAYVDVLDKNNRTPLLHAVNNSRFHLAKCLLKNGANVNAMQDERPRNYYKQTSLHIAVFKGDFPLIKLLLSYGANKDLKNSGGFKARYFLSYGFPKQKTSAWEKQNTELSKLLN